MAYTALYRKYRPLKFDEMVGEDHITTTLKNQIIANRVGHAYLFNGGRGTGKTSAAKILARAVNCLNPQNGEPCNECETCKAMLAGTLTDVVEMDAASNNGVEDIRNIREEVSFLPAVAKYRVYIIDEVHMLSSGAFNSLLKTLEEPPEHVKFILATTEPQKLPATILSRCQRFDFKRISVENIIKRLRFICKESQIQIEDKALEIIAELSEGAARDAISILERCTHGYSKENEIITEDNVRDLVGIPKLEYINKIVKNIVDKNAEEIAKSTNEIINEGKDVDTFLWESIKYVKDILVFKTINSLEIYSKEEIELIKIISEKISKEELLNLIYNLSELAKEMKWSSQKSIVFQTGMLKLCIEQSSNKTIALEDFRVVEEKKINVQPKEQVSDERKETTQNNIKSYNTEENKEYLSYWTKVLDSLKQEGKIMVYTNLIGTKAKIINDMTVGIEFNNRLSDFGKNILEQHENKAEIEKLISIEAGQRMNVKFIDKNGNDKKNNDSNQETKKIEDLDIQINIIDE